MGILNLVTYIPLIGAIVILFFLRKENGAAIRYTATFFAVVDFIVSLPLDWSRPGAISRSGPRERCFRTPSRHPGRSLRPLRRLDFARRRRPRP